jgi:hypothetical protein
MGGRGGQGNARRAAEAASQKQEPASHLAPMPFKASALHRTMLIPSAPLMMRSYRKTARGHRVPNSATSSAKQDAGARKRGIARSRANSEAHCYVFSTMGRGSASPSQRLMMAASSAPNS